MTTISKDTNSVTLINVFTVKEENQKQLIDLLIQATDTSIKKVPGFISASLHRSLDGTKVTMYAQWKSVEAYEAMRKNTGPVPYLEQAMAIAKFEPGMYEVVEIFDAIS
jgi:quinol monooxygenase YgiN